MTIVLCALFLRALRLIVFNLGTSAMVITFPLRVGCYYIEFSFILDRISISGVCLVLFISFCVFLFSHRYMGGDVNNVRFILILAGFVLSMLILLVRNSIPSLLVGWDGLGVTSFLLIVYYDRKTNNRSGLITFTINRFGDAVLIGTLIFFLAGGNLSVGVGFGSLVVISYCIIAITKRAQYPFSIWLPLAIDAPTPVSALVHRRTLVTAGLFLLARLRPEGLNIYLLVVGGITLCVGGFCAVFSSDLKKLIANSTLSNLGLIMFVLSLSNKRLMLFHLFSHALFKAGLFITAGAILINRFGAQDSRALYGGAKNRPILGSMLRVFFISSIGLFFTSAFFSKHQIALLRQGNSVNLLVLITVVLGVVFTVLYRLRFRFIILREKLNLAIRSQIPMLVVGSISFLATSSILFGNLACRNLLLRNFSFEIPLNQIIMIRLFFFFALSNSLRRNNGVSMFQMDTVMDSFTALGYYIQRFQQTDIGYGRLEAKAFLEKIQVLAGASTGILRPSRVNLTILIIGRCLMLLFM